MSEAALSLIPWVEDKVIRSASWIKTKKDTRRRLKEYEQIISWTQSSLQVSTAFDWGHTCDFAEALNKSASDILVGGGHQFCWAFASRTLLNKVMTRSIDPTLWLQGEQNPFKAQLMTSWILFTNDAVDEWRRLYESHRPYRALENLRALHDSWGRLDDINVLKREREKAKTVLEIWETAFYVFYGSTFARCCESDRNCLRKRALRSRSCHGVDLVLKENIREEITFEEWRWAGLKRAWLDFIHNWDKIVHKASTLFPFPITPGIDSQVFHDMATGYVGSSSMLRNGGKFTSRNGTTIVHPGERAAIVSSSCHILSMDNSAIARNGFRRQWSNAALEFARYATVRCDLVNPSRMNFKDAVEDWKSQYARWDRAPRTLSEWANGESYDFAADDYRLVLIRQALGTMHSINVYSIPGIDSSVFGGFLAIFKVSDIPTCEERVLFLDQPLTVTVTVHKDQRNLRNKFVLDKWGASDCQVQKKSDYYCKLFQESGRPGIYKIMDVTIEATPASCLPDELISFT